MSFFITSLGILSVTRARIDVNDESIEADFDDDGFLLEGNQDINLALLFVKNFSTLLGQTITTLTFELEGITYRYNPNPQTPFVVYENFLPLNQIKNQFNLNGNISDIYNELVLKFTFPFFFESLSLIRLPLFRNFAK